MRIGIDIRAIGRQMTGDETYTRELVKHLLAIDKKNKYYLYTNISQKQEIESVKDKLGILSAANVKIVPVFPASKALWTFWSLPKHLKENPVDILHVQYITPQWLPKGVKVVTTIHDISFNFFPRHIKYTDLLFLRALIPRSLKRADKIIGVSRWTRDEIVEFYHISRKKVVAVQNGVDVKKFGVKKTPEELQRVKNKYGLPKNFILYVGTLQPRKNIPFLIKAFKELKEKYKDEKEIRELSLVIVGSRKAHNYDRGIEELIAGLTINEKACQEAVLFPGYIDSEDLAAIYQSADSFCFPSLYEGFGIPIIEAMASGIPVVCSDSSCHPEVAGGAALMYKENNLKDIVSKLHTVSTNQEVRLQLIEKGYHQSGNFSWQRCAEETLALYKKIS